jgi:hypothetical protein
MGSMIRPPIWSSRELESARRQAIHLFRKERTEEPHEIYLGLFDRYERVVSDLLAATSNLTGLEERSDQVLTDPSLLCAFRYLAGPPISEDDLRTLAEVTLAPGTLRQDEEARRRLVEIIEAGLDVRRFPWLAEERQPTETERRAAVVASTALIATSGSQAKRRNLGKAAQEAAVKRAMLEAGFQEVPGRAIRTLAEAPSPGEFCGESTLGSRRADVVVRLRDTRVMPVECKVSNSAVNSVKRLNNDAAVKAEVWKKDFGELNVVPAAVLSGVFELHNLEDAQRRGLAVFWAHHLDALVAWVGAAV